MTSEDTTTATALATANAAKAVEIAALAQTTATALASKTAESNATITTNMEWIKKSLSAIEGKLNEMDKAFVTAAQHAEVLKCLDTHETRLNVLEGSNTKTMVMLTIGTGILSILVGLLTYHIVST